MLTPFRSSWSQREDRHGSRSGSDWGGNRREAGAMVLQLTEAKWMLRFSATEVGSEPVENELFVCTKVQVTNLSVFHRANG